MHNFKGTQILLRIFIGESDKHNHRPLYSVLLELFKEKKMAGATAIRGIAGFGAKSHLHTADILRLSQDLPIIIEVVDTQEKIDAILPLIDEIMPEGLITMEKVEVIRYAPKL